MSHDFLSIEETKKAKIPDLLDKLSSDEKGISSSEANAISAMELPVKIDCKNTVLTRLPKKKLIPLSNSWVISGDLYRG